MKLTKDQQRMVVVSVRRQGLEVSPVMPDNVSRWPLALREAWQRGYDGLPEDPDGRVAIERYRGAYHEGRRDRALVGHMSELMQGVRKGLDEHFGVKR